MVKIDKILRDMRANPKNVRVVDLEKVCTAFFGQPRTTSGSHKIYKTPWKGDPRINIQGASGKAKAYQVKQVLEAIEKLQNSEKEKQKGKGDG